MHRRERILFLYLFLLGICLAGLYLALSPLLAGPDRTRDPLFQAWRAFLPWLPQGYWTVWLPNLLWLRFAWFDPASVVGNANLLFVMLCLALLGVLLAAQAGWLQRHLSQRSQRTCAWLILSFAALFALTLLVSPPRLDIFSRDMLFTWLAGRAVAIYHVNPYIVAPTMYLHDVATTPLQQFFSSDIAKLPPGPLGTSGPIGVDIGILVSLLGHDQLAATLLSFRVVGLFLHLLNALFIWLILRTSKPEMSLPALVLYAWNPLLLLLGVAQMHQELIIVFFVLLAIYFLQRDANVLSWFFLLLAVLTNPICLLLLPFFLRMIMCKARFLVFGEQFLLWLGLLSLSLVVCVLAYLPYWDGWGWSGLVTNIALVFLPSHAQNSLESMLLALGVSSSISAYWPIVLLGFMGLFLLFSFWLADTVDWLLLCASWLVLIFLVFQPLYWPWYMILPLALVLCCVRSKTLLLTIFLLLGTLFSYYAWSRMLGWQGQALVVLGLPCLLWGWYIFLNSSWRMMRGNEEALAEAQQQVAQRPRSPWLSRPSWPSRPGRIR